MTVPVRDVQLPSGAKIGVVGPTNKFSDVFSEPAHPWRRGNRPRISDPYHGQTIGRSHKFVWELESEEEGQFEVRILVRNGDEKTFYKFIVRDAKEVSLKELGIEIPEGRGTAWVAFIPADGSQTRYSMGRKFFVDSHNKEWINLNCAILLGNNNYRSSESAFRTNLASLSYEQNLELLKEEIQEGKSVLSSAPTTIQMSLGHLCNVDCIMCPTGRNPDRTTIPNDIMNQLPELFPFLDRIVIRGGEPLIYKSLKKIIANACKYPQLTIVLSTNGTLLMDGWMDIILNGRFDLVISIDATCKETYERIRRRARWDQLIRSLDYIRNHRKSNYPHISFAFCTMRSNYKETVDFVDFAHKWGAQTVYYNLMAPNMLEQENKNENLHNDEDACTELAFLIREAQRRGKELGIPVRDKVLGYILPKFPNLVLSEDDLSVLSQDIRQNAKSHIEANIKANKLYWERKGGKALLDVPAVTPERDYILSGNAHSSDIAKKQGSSEFYLLQDFFCLVPFRILNIDVENTFVCCHAYEPFQYITYGPARSIFDVWNHPLIQIARQEMHNGSAEKRVCLPKCPIYRYGGWKQGKEAWGLFETDYA